MNPARHGRIRHWRLRPPRGLSGRHVQTILGGAPALRRLRAWRERWELPDGDFLDIDWVSRRGSDWALVLPGLTGNLGSAYAARLLRRLAAAGYRAGLLNYRGHSGIPNRLPTGYHAGFTTDLDLVARRLHARCGAGIVAGYSMGGNLLLKWLGECGADVPVYAAVAASVPFELAPAAERLRSGSARGYDRYLLGGLRRYVRRKFASVASPVALPALRRLGSIMEFDEFVTAPLHGFRGAADYYARASCGPWLRCIGIPTLIVNAVDDPLVPRETLPRPEQLAASVTLDLAVRGGHVGFVAGGRLLPRFALDRHLLAFLAVQRRRRPRDD